MTTYACKGGTDLALTLEDKVALIKSALDKINRPLKKVLILPPDFTRFNSNAGVLTNILADRPCRHHARPRDPFPHDGSGNQDHVR